MHKIVAAGLAACLGLAAWKAPAQPVRPDTIDYDMQEGLAGWKVYDVKVDGLIKALTDRNR
jgi:hypothetical protein